MVLQTIKVDAFEIKFTFSIKTDTLTKSLFLRRTLSVPVIDGIQWDDFSINPVYAKDSHSR